MALLRLTALLAVAALALTATASGALTPSQYRARLGTICEKVEAQTKALGNGQPMSRTQIVQFLAARLGVMRQEYMSLRALQPPATLAAAHRRLLVAAWTTVNLDTKAVGQMQRGADPNAALMKEWSSSSWLSSDEALAWMDVGVPGCQNADTFTLVSSGK